MLVFGEGGKLEDLEKNPQSKNENQQQNKPTDDGGSWNGTQATVVGGKCFHHCTIPAPLFCFWLLLHFSDCRDPQSGKAIES